MRVWAEVRVLKQAHVWGRGLRSGRGFGLRSVGGDEEVEVQEGALGCGWELWEGVIM